MTIFGLKIQIIKNNQYVTNHDISLIFGAKIQIHNFCFVLFYFIFIFTLFCFICVTLIWRTKSKIRYFTYRSSRWPCHSCKWHNGAKFCYPDVYDSSVIHRQIVSWCCNSSNSSIQKLTWWKSKLNRLLIKDKKD